MGMYVFLGELGGIADLRGSVGLGCRFCNSEKISCVAGAGGDDSRDDTALEKSPSFARDSALFIALSS